MSKYKAPAPKLADAFRWLPWNVCGRLNLRVALYPDTGLEKMYVGVELVVTMPNGTFKLWRRWGERVSMASDDQLKGALLRACIGASGFLEGRDVREVEKQALWDCDTL